MSTAIAKNLMAEMKLLGMLAAFDQSVTDATRDQTSYTEFLDTLLQAESDYRQERKTGYRIKAAKFTLRPAFEDIDFTASRSISKAQIKELYGLQWLAEGRPVLLIGQTGVGKTFIAQAAGLHACACGKSVLYMTVTTWLENLALARSSGTYLRYRDKLAKPDLVILDDMGMRKTLVHRGAGSVRNARGTIDRQVHHLHHAAAAGSLDRGDRRSGHRRCHPRPTRALRSRPSTSPARAIAASKHENLPARKKTRKNRRLRLRR